MKLPKGFGGKGFGDVMGQMQNAMARAQNLEAELAQDRVNIDKGPIKAVFDGTGMLLAIKIDPTIVDAEDVEALEDLVVGVVRDGFEKATEIRNAKVAEIMPNVPNLGI